MRSRIYIEITNRCNLSCDFCPGTRRPPRTMTPAEFRTLTQRLRGETGYLYFHVLGEPLLHPQLPELLAIAGELAFRVCLVTNGTLLTRQRNSLLKADALHKISVSLHSYEGNGGVGNLEEYLQQVWDTCLPLSQRGVLCALRLWNDGTAQRCNSRVQAFLSGKTFPGMPGATGLWGPTCFWSRQRGSIGRTLPPRRAEPIFATA